MQHSAQQAYETVGKATLSTRELEAAALFKAARLLETCKQNWDSAENPKRLDDALRRNLTLWSVLQAGLTSPDHELPQQLRVDILNLSGFIDRRSFEIMAKPAKEKLQALIDINRHLACGLAVTPSMSEEPAA